MATNFGFIPATSGKRYFVSYKSEDSLRVGKIARRLHELGVPLWYDGGIVGGAGWAAEISRNADECEAVLLFASKRLFKKDNFVHNEFQQAKVFKKPIYVVWMDDIDPKKDVNRDLMLWYFDIKKEPEYIEAFSIPSELIAEGLIIRFNLLSSLSPEAKKQISDKYVDSIAPSKGVRKKRILVYTISVIVLLLVLGAVGSVLCFSNSEDSDPNSNESSKLENVSVGDRLYFGNYILLYNTPEPIQWRVLAVDDEKALLISEKVLDSVVYSKSSTEVTWETSYLREWLNQNFYNSAFSSDEKSYIVETTVVTPDNSKYGSIGGNSTVDKVFALSIDEVKQYFSDDKDRMAAATDYAIKRGSYVNAEYVVSDEELASWWWLRSPGETNKLAARVFNSGEIDYTGFDVGWRKVSVRPAMWVYKEFLSVQD